MSVVFPTGVWPVMLTPFAENGEVDYLSLERLVHFYEQNGVSGLFAVCQSSEMFYLSLRERVEIVSFLKKVAHVPVIASGHTAWALSDQIDEGKAVLDAGADALILITNRLAQPTQSDAVWQRNLDTLLNALPEDAPLGFYECPYPYKRLLTPAQIDFCAQSGRFYFLKDTCCDAARMRQRIDQIRGTSLQLYNANIATLLDTLRMGCAGFSGVMANFHPDLFAWLCANYQREPEKAQLLQAGLTMCSQIEKQLYPVNAKTYLMQLGVFSSNFTRTRDAGELTPLFEDEIRQMAVLADHLRGIIAR